MAAITDVLNRIFNQKVIVKRMPGNRLKTIDYDKLQSIGNAVTGQFNSVRSTLHNQSYKGSGYSSPSEMAQIDAARTNMYIDYESMDSDAILSAALDIYADECTVKNEHGRVLTITSDDPKKKAILHNLYHDILNIEFNLWHWVRTLCKFGDLFLYLPTAPSIGVVDAIPIHPSLLKRDDYGGPNGDQTQYIYEGDTVQNFGKNVFDFHEIAHFRVLTDTMYLPYGKSMLEGARKIWKQLTMMEDAMLIHRIMRAPERRIFKLDVGNLPDNAIDQHIEAVANQMKKVPFIDPQTGDYNLRFNLMNMLEDFFLPTRGGESATEISTLEGMGNAGSLEDIEYLRVKMMAFLKIPNAYLGYDEGVEGKGTLAAEDVKFARFIERIQKIVVSELEKIGHIHLYMQGYRGEELIDFKLELSTPSLIYERQKVDLMNEKATLVGNIKEQGLHSEQWIYQNIYGMNETEWKAERDLVIQDKMRAFRLEQIASEGNDPKTTGKSFGTPHDIVSMQMAGKSGKFADTPSQDVKRAYKPDKREGNPGRPPKPGSWEREKDPSLGRDPTGRLAMQTPLTAGKDWGTLIKSMERKIINLHESQAEEPESINNDKLSDDITLNKTV